MEPTIEKLNIPAVEIQLGDTVQGLSERDYAVLDITRFSGSNTPADVAALGGWVNIKGDTEDEYYVGCYGVQQEYFAAPDQMVDVCRPA
jgi:anthranilate phosphoribosyltransferase